MQGEISTKSKTKASMQFFHHSIGQNIGETKPSVTEKFRFENQNSISVVAVFGVFALIGIPNVKSRNLQIGHRLMKSKL